MATALGLAAAIPAAVFYNYFGSTIFASLAREWKTFRSSS